MGYSPRGRKESDTTEQLHFTFMYGIVNIVSFYFNWLAVVYLKGFRNNQTVTNNFFEHQERREALLPWGRASWESKATGTHHVHHM